MSATRVPPWTPPEVLELLSAWVTPPEVGFSGDYAWCLARGRLAVWRPDRPGSPCGVQTVPADVLAAGGRRFVGVAVPRDLEAEHRERRRIAREARRLGGAGGAGGEGGEGSEGGEGGASPLGASPLPPLAPSVLLVEAGGTAVLWPRFLSRADEAEAGLSPGAGAPSPSTATPGALDDAALLSTLNAPATAIAAARHPRDGAAIFAVATGGGGLYALRVTAAVARGKDAPLWITLQDMRWTDPPADGAAGAGEQGADAAVTPARMPGAGVRSPSSGGVLGAVSRLLGLGQPGSGAFPSPRRLFTPFRSPTPYRGSSSESSEAADAAFSSIAFALGVGPTGLALATAAAGALWLWAVPAGRRAWEDDDADEDGEGEDEEGEETADERARRGGAALQDRFVLPDDPATLADPNAPQPDYALWRIDVVGEAAERLALGPDATIAGLDVAGLESERDYARLVELGAVEGQAAGPAGRRRGPGAGAGLPGLTALARLSPQPPLTSFSTSAVPPQPLCASIVLLLAPSGGAADGGARGPAPRDGALLVFRAPLSGAAPPEDLDGARVLPLASPPPADALALARGPPETVPARPFDKADPLAWVASLALTPSRPLPLFVWRTGGEGGVRVADAGAAEPERAPLQDSWAGPLAAAGGAPGGWLLFDVREGLAFLPMRDEDATHAVLGGASGRAGAAAGVATTAAALADSPTFAPRGSLRFQTPRVSPLGGAPFATPERQAHAQPATTPLSAFQTPVGGGRVAPFAGDVADAYGTPRGAPVPLAGSPIEASPAPIAGSPIEGSPAPISGSPIEGTPASPGAAPPTSPREGGGVEDEELADAAAEAPAEPEAPEEADAEAEADDEGMDATPVSAAPVVESPSPTPSPPVASSPYGASTPVASSPYGASTPVASSPYGTSPSPASLGGVVARPSPGYAASPAPRLASASAVAEASRLLAAASRGEVPAEALAHDLDHAGALAPGPLLEASRGLADALPRSWRGALGPDEEEDRLASKLRTLRAAGAALDRGGVFDALARRAGRRAAAETFAGLFAYAQKVAAALAAVRAAHRVELEAHERVGATDGAAGGAAAGAADGAALATPGAFATPASAVFRAPAAPGLASTALSLREPGTVFATGVRGSPTAIAPASLVLAPQTLAAFALAAALSAAGEVAGRPLRGGPAERPDRDAFSARPSDAATALWDAVALCARALAGEKPGAEGGAAATPQPASPSAGAPDLALFPPSSRWEALASLHALCCAASDAAAAERLEQRSASPAAFAAVQSLAREGLGEQGAFARRAFGTLPDGASPSSFWTWACGAPAAGAFAALAAAALAVGEDLSSLPAKRAPCDALARDAVSRGLDALAAAGVVGGGPDERSADGADGADALGSAKGLVGALRPDASAAECSRDLRTLLLPALLSRALRLLEIGVSAGRDAEAVLTVARASLADVARVARAHDVHGVLFEALQALDDRQAIIDAMRDSVADLAFGEVGEGWPRSGPDSPPSPRSPLGRAPPVAGSSLPFAFFVFGRLLRDGRTAELLELPPVLSPALEVWLLAGEGGRRPPGKADPLAAALAPQRRELAWLHLVRRGEHAEAALAIERSVAAAQEKALPRDVGATAAPAVAAATPASLRLALARERAAALAASPGWPLSVSSALAARAPHVKREIVTLECLEVAGADGAADEDGGTGPSPAAPLSLAPKAAALACLAGGNPSPGARVGAAQRALDAAEEAEAQAPQASALGWAGLAEARAEVDRAWLRLLGDERDWRSSGDDGESADASLVAARAEELAAAACEAFAAQGADAGADRVYRALEGVVRDWREDARESVLEAFRAGCEGEQADEADPEDMQE